MKQIKSAGYPRVRHCANGAFSLLFLILVACSSAASQLRADLERATPEGTIQSFCKSGVWDLNSKYFHVSDDHKSDLPPFRTGWVRCVVEKVQRTKNVGLKVGDTTIEADDIGVLFKTYGISEKGVPTNDEWLFTLRRYPGGWKIIMYGLIDVT